MTIYIDRVVGIKNLTFINSEIYFISISVIDSINISISVGVGNEVETFSIDIVIKFKYIFDDVNKIIKTFSNYR